MQNKLNITAFTSQWIRFTDINVVCITKIAKSNFEGTNQWSCLLRQSHTKSKSHAQILMELGSVTIPWSVEKWSQEHQLSLWLAVELSGGCSEMMRCWWLVNEDWFAASDGQKTCSGFTTIPHARTHHPLPLPPHTVLCQRQYITKNHAVGWSGIVIENLSQDTLTNILISVPENRQVYSKYI